MTENYGSPTHTADSLIFCRLNKCSKDNLLSKMRSCDREHSTIIEERTNNLGEKLEGTVATEEA